MSATHEQAVDDMFALLKPALAATVIASNVGWPSVPNAALPPPTPVPWARVVVKHSSGGQVGFGDGQRKYLRGGVLITQVMVPRGKGLTLGYQLAKIVGDALEGKATSHGVWFRNVRIAEAGADGNFEQINVTADFEYTEVK